MTRRGIQKVNVGGMSLLLASLVTACATTPSPAAQRIIVTEASHVARCTYLSDVEGSSGFGNLASSTGIQNAKNEALDKAAAAGATHVVWTNTSWFMGSSAAGKAYRCD
jgi:hypothetical protein